MNAPPVMLGQVLAGKYRIERVLGEGGMGVVVEAHDISLERRVAIKFLLSDFAKHPEATQRFTREARAAVKIQSEHVARVIDVSTLENGAPYMVMEFLEGSDLSQVIETSGQLPVEDAALYVIQACEALAEAHAHGIIHRDLKPANLFLARQAGGSQKIKVLDFGISKTLTATDPGLLGSLTRTSSMMGSPLYMSPEQMKSTRDVDFRADIWGLGVILYEALAASTPFTGGSIPEISAKILLEDPRPITELRPDVPEELVAVITRTLRKRPDERFANVGELAVALMPFAHSRARGNVERIVRVLSAAGMANGDFLASLALSEPAPDNPKSTGRVAPLSQAELASSGKRKQSTLANWGQTQMERSGIPRSKNTRTVMLGIAASLLALGGAIGLWLRSPDPVASPVAAAPEAVTPTAEAAAPAAVAPAPQVAPVNDPAALEPPPAEPAAAGESAAVTPTAPKAKRAITATRKPSAASRSKASVTAAKGEAKAKETSHSVDFKSKFGSRK